MESKIIESFERFITQTAREFTVTNDDVMSIITNYIDYTRAGYSK